MAETKAIALVASDTRSCMIAFMSEQLTRAAPFTPLATATTGGRIVAVAESTISGEGHS